GLRAGGNKVLPRARNAKQAGPFHGGMERPGLHETARFGTPEAALSRIVDVERAPLIRPPLRSGHLLPQGEKGIPWLINSAHPSPLEGEGPGVRGALGSPNPSELRRLGGPRHGGRRALALSHHGRNSVE